jgi:hypothetical protein
MSIQQYQEYLKEKIQSHATRTSLICIASCNDVTSIVERTILLFEKIITEGDSNDIQEELERLRKSKLPGDM